MKRIKLEPVKSIEGDLLNVDGRPTSLLDLLKLAVVSCPPQITPHRVYNIEDTDNAIQFLTAVRESDGKTLDLENENYKWLIGIVTILAPRMLRHNARQILNAMSNLAEDNPAPKTRPKKGG